MAEYLIQDTTLDAIADAINAKTGGSSAMTPSQMAAAIGNIPSGGGATLLADYTASEDVSVMRITMTEEMYGYDFYIMSVEGEYIRTDGDPSYTPNASFNTDTSTRTYLNPIAVGTKRVWTWFARKIGSDYYAVVGGRLPYVTTFQTTELIAYKTTERFVAGTTMKMYGVKA